MDNIKIKVTRTVEITPKMLEDLLVTALEGGTGYWACLGERTEPEHKTAYKQYEHHEEANWTPHHVYVPMSPGGNIQILDAETTMDDDPDVLGDLNLPNMIRGLDLMAKEFPGDFQEFIEGDYDSNHADCFMQLAVMGELVFG